MANLTIPAGIDAREALRILVETALANQHAAGPLAEAWRPLGLTDPAQAQAFLDNPTGYSPETLIPFYEAAQRLGLLPPAEARPGIGYHTGDPPFSGYITGGGIDLPIPAPPVPGGPGGPGPGGSGTGVGPEGFGPFEGLLPSPPVPILGPSTHVAGQLTGPNFFREFGMVNPIWAAYMAPEGPPPVVPGGASTVPDISGQAGLMASIFGNRPYEVGSGGGGGGEGGGGVSRDSPDPFAGGRAPGDSGGGAGDPLGGGSQPSGPGSQLGGGISGGDSPAPGAPGIGGQVGSEGSPGGGRGPGTGGGLGGSSDPGTGGEAFQLMRPLFDFSAFTPFGADRGLARGGVVSQPSRPLVGEAGPEAVIPLRNQPGADLGDVRLGDLLAQLAQTRTEKPRHTPWPVHPSLVPDLIWDDAAGDWRVRDRSFEGQRKMERNVIPPQLTPRRGGPR